MNNLVDLLDGNFSKNTLFKYSGDQDKQLLQQLTGLMNNETTFSLTMIAMEQNHEEQIRETENMWPGVKAFVYVVFITFAFIPNLFLCITHCQQRKNK